MKDNVLELAMNFYKMVIGQWTVITLLHFSFLWHKNMWTWHLQGALTKKMQSLESGNENFCNLWFVRSIGIFILDFIFTL